MLSSIRLVRKLNINSTYRLTSTVTQTNIEKFEVVYSLPFIKYFSIFNRLKVYQIVGTSVGVPTCGLLEISNVVQEETFLAASVIGVTAAMVLGVASLPFRNIIGFIYISEDNRKIKISSLDYWGKRKDRVVLAEEWIPLFELKPKMLDVVYLSPKLTDGTEYKLFLKYGNIENLQKINAVLE